MKRGEIVSYNAMCLAEGSSLQRGMNFHLRQTTSVILMSVRKGAPYADQIEEDGCVLIYEGHDIARTPGGPDPKAVDQPASNPGGSLTQNGLFFEAAMRFRRGESGPELVKVYEKIRQGIWAFNGLFRLVDGWRETSGDRKVFKFRLELESDPVVLDGPTRDITHDRLIPTAVKLEVWKRDHGRCVMCGSQDNLHFDHDLPYSKGGSSLVARNIRILCARHNLAKSDKIE